MYVIGVFLRKGRKSAVSARGLIPVWIVRIMTLNTIIARVMEGVLNDVSKHRD